MRYARFFNKEIAQDYQFRHQKLIFISHALSLPDELKSFATAFEFALPTTIELSRMVAEEAGVWAMRGDNSKLRAEKASVTALVNHLGGLTRTDARRLIRNASRDDGAITASDVSAVSSARYALLGTLMTWMAQNDAPVLLMATANNIAALPPELMRKGRLDEIFSSTCRRS